jgi:hypothetical protein
MIKPVISLVFDIPPELSLSLDIQHNGVKEQNTMMFQKEETLGSHDKRSDVHVAASMIPKPSSRSCLVLLSIINVVHDNLPTYQEIRNWE